MKTPRWKALAADWVWSNTPCCREMTRLLSRGLDTRLPWSVRWRMALHLRFCAWCERYRRQLTEVQLLVRRLLEREAADAQAGLTPEERDRIRATLRKDSL